MDRKEGTEGNEGNSFAMNTDEIGRRLTRYFARTKHPIQFAYLFGSVARGQALPFSDVDIAVYLDERVNGNTLWLLGGIVSDLMHELHREDVDILPLNSAPPRLAFRVLEQGRLLYSHDELLRAQAETRILQRYFDESPVEKEYFRYQDARILAGKMIERTPEMIDAASVRERLTYIKQMRERL